MALFKILKGNSNNLPKKYNEGYCYFTKDEHKFYIDINDSSRVPLNAEDATTLLNKTIINEITTDNKDNIPNGQAVIDYINDNHYIVHLSSVSRWSPQSFQQYNFNDSQIVNMLNKNGYHINFSLDEEKYIDDIETKFRLKKYLSQQYSTYIIENDQSFGLLFNSNSSIPETIHLIFDCYSN